MLLGNAVKFAQMPFCLIPKVLYPIDVVLPVGKMCTMVDAQMVVEIPSVVYSILGEY